MRTAKRLSAILLALVMALALSITAFAANDGSITISNAQVGETYTIYKLFDLTYAGEAEVGQTKPDSVAYTYTKTGETDAFFIALTDQGSPFTLTATNTTNVYAVTLNANTTEDDEVISFLKGLADGVLPTAADSHKIGDGDNMSADGAYTFTGLSYGYYYITSTTGTVVTIDSTMKDVTVRDKNNVPTVEKKVKNNTAGETAYAESTTATIGDTVEFQITVTAQPGADSYVLHDKLDAGLTLAENPNFTVKVDNTSLNENTDYTVTTSGLTDGCSFEIEFTDTYLNQITADNTKIVITYMAVLNKDAVIGGNGNKNDTWLTYGSNNSRTETSTATVYSYSFDVVKTDGEDKVLTGATFELYQTKTGEGENATLSDKVSFVVETNGTYRVATTDEIADTATTTTTEIAAGSVTISGLRNGTYYLKEIAAPTGYNPLSDPETVVVENKNNDATVTTGTEGAADTYVSGGVQVINEKGTELPSTGGIGTTIFYVVGAVLVIGAGVLLVTRKRMKNDR